MIIRHVPEYLKPSVQKRALLCYRIADVKDYIKIFKISSA
jgi:hypothetical protein